MKVRRRVRSQSVVLSIIASSSVLGCSSRSTDGADTNAAETQSTDTNAAGSGASEEPSTQGAMPSTQGAMPSTPDAMPSAPGAMPSEALDSPNGDSGPTPSGGAAGSEATPEVPSATGGTDGGTNAVPPGTNDCPASLRDLWPPGEDVQPCAEGASCEFPRQCSSGEHVFTVTCTDGAWELDADCANDYDFCPYLGGNTSPEMYCWDGQWDTYQCPPSLACESPASCPQEPPSVGSSCPGATGGPPKGCGYPCDDDASTWTVFTCTEPTAPNYDNEDWTSDGACD